MKHIKRVLALLLALALGVGLAVPAFAQESIIEHSEATENPAKPVITAQPEPYAVPHNPATFFWVQVKAEIPNGDPVGYQWYEARPKGDIPVNCTGGYFHNYNEPNYNRLDILRGIELYCVVYNLNDSTAEAGPHRVVSQTVTVQPYSRVWYVVSNILATIVAILMSPLLLAYFVHSLIFGNSYWKLPYIVMAPYLLLVFPLAFLLTAIAY